MAETAVGIAGWGSDVPESYISAAEIAARSGIPEPVIREKFGLTRKPIPGPDDHPNEMALRAARRALARAECDPNEVDLILCTTEEWKEYPLRTSGVQLAHALGAHRAWALDVQLRCGTTIAALRVARAMMRSEPDLRTVLIAGGYRNGDLVDYTNERARFLINLSAGGGALLLRRNHPRNQILATSVIVDGSFADDVIVPVGGTRTPLDATNLAQFRLDVPDPAGMKSRLDERSMANFLLVIDQALAAAGRQRSEIGYLNILHMKRSAHDHVLRELALEAEQTVYLSDYGHMGQQDQPLSIELGLDQGRLREGDLMVMVAAGIGYAWAAAVVQWGAARSESEGLNGN